MKVGENIDLQFNFSIIKTPRINYFPIFQAKTAQIIFIFIYYVYLWNTGLKMGLSPHPLTPSESFLHSLCVICACISLQTARSAMPCSSQTCCGSKPKLWHHQLIRWTVGLFNKFFVEKLKMLYLTLRSRNKINICMKLAKVSFFFFF